MYFFLKHSGFIRLFKILFADFPEVGAGYDGLNRKRGSTSYCAILCPCIRKDSVKENYECKETSIRLLNENSVNEKENGHLPSNNDTDNNDPHSNDGHVTHDKAGAIYRDSPTPSAPILDEGNELYPDVEVKGKHFYDRSESVPVQAISWDSLDMEYFLKRCLKMGGMEKIENSVYAIDGCLLNVDAYMEVHL